MQATPYQCPFCGSENIEKVKIESIPGENNIEVNCTDCGTEYVEVYRYQGFLKNGGFIPIEETEGP